MLCGPKPLVARRNRFSFLSSKVSRLRTKRPMLRCIGGVILRHDVIVTNGALESERRSHDSAETPVCGMVWLGLDSCS